MKAYCPYFNLCLAKLKKINDRRNKLKDKFKQLLT